MKNFFCTIIALCIFVGTTSAALAKNVTFEDITDHWARNDIIELAEKGIVNGQTETTYNPEASVSRAEFIKLISCVFETEFSGKTSVFADVPADLWVNPYVAYALDTKIIFENEYIEGFKPDILITRDEAALWVSRALALKEDGEVSFADIGDIKNKDAVRTVVKAGILKGFDDNTFKPLNTTTRAEAAVIINRVIKYAASLIQPVTPTEPSEEETNVPSKEPEVPNTVVNKLEGIKQQKIASGRYHYAIIKSDGTVWVWGNKSAKDVLGDYYKAENTPTKVDGLKDIVSVTATEYATFAVDAGGNVWAWGKNEHGQLGIGSTENKKSPVKIDGIDNITSINGGASHVVAVKSDGTVWVWGKNEHGQLGLGVDKVIYNSDEALEYKKEMTQDINIPTQVPNFTNAVNVQAGEEHTAVLTSSKKVWTCGSNKDSQLLRFSINTLSYEFKEAENLKDITDISVGNNHMLATVSDGTTWMYTQYPYNSYSVGSTNDNSIGVKKTITNEDRKYFSYDIPTNKNTVTHIKSIYAGDISRLAFIDNDGIVWYKERLYSFSDIAKKTDGKSRTFYEKFRKRDDLEGVVEISLNGVLGFLALKSDGTVLMVNDTVTEILNINE